MYSIFQTNECRRTGSCARRDVSLNLLGLPLIVSCSGGVKWWMTFCPGVTFTSSGGERVIHPHWVLSPGHRSRVIKLKIRLSSAEIKNEWDQTSNSPVCFRGVEIHNLSLSLFMWKYENNYLRVSNYLRNAYPTIRPKEVTHIHWTCEIIYKRRTFSCAVLLVYINRSPTDALLKQKWVREWFSYIFWGCDKRLKYYLRLEHFVW
jgi:hypothetical protein